MWKSVHMCQSYSKVTLGLFFLRHGVDAHTLDKRSSLLELLHLAPENVWKHAIYRLDALPIAPTAVSKHWPPPKKKWHTCRLIVYWTPSDYWKKGFCIVSIAMLLLDLTSCTFKQHIFFASHKLRMPQNSGSWYCCILSIVLMWPCGH